MKNNTESNKGEGIYSLADFEASLGEEERTAFRDAQLVFTLSSSDSSTNASLARPGSKYVYPRSALWLGGQFSARDLDTLLKRGTTHVLTCNGRRPFFFPGTVQPRVKVIDWDDEAQQELDELRGALDFIKDALLNSGVVLIHCTAGRSRSAAVVLAFFIECLDMNYDEALAALKLKRPWVDPNPGFVRQLREFEANYRGKDLAFTDKSPYSDKSTSIDSDSNGSKCDLCLLKKTTKWFRETSEFVILECDQCDQPMAVWREHTMEISLTSQIAMETALRAVANDYFGDENAYYIDKKQRTISTHLHWHARQGKDPWKAMREIASKL